jgi:hypothetical protein
MKNKAITLIVVGMLLFTFCTPSSAHAFAVSATMLTIWGISVGAAAIAVARNEASKNEGDQKEANVQKREQNSTISPAAVRAQESTG